MSTISDAIARQKEAEAKKKSKKTTTKKSTKE
jgi:hypothetical protein